MVYSQTEIRKVQRKLVCPNLDILKNHLPDYYTLKGSLFVLDGLSRIDRASSDTEREQDIYRVIRCWEDPLVKEMVLRFQAKRGLASLMNTFNDVAVSTMDIKSMRLVGDLAQHYWESPQIDYVMDVVSYETYRNRGETFQEWEDHIKKREEYAQKKKSAAEKERDSVESDLKDPSLRSRTRQEKIDGIETAVKKMRELKGTELLTSAAEN